MGLYYRHPSSFRHETGGHPENPRRLAAIEESLAERDWLELERVEAPAADRDQLLRVHDPAHVDAIESFAAAGGGAIDLDTVASEGSWEAALHAAGGAAAAVDRLLAEEGGFAFCGLRPPGHHAERDRAMGFCLFNNVAVAAAHALAAHGLERVLIFDWDVHHGNGTEAIFYDSASVLYASVHQSPLYPGTGAASDTGTADGEGFTVNLPVPPGSGPELYLPLVQHLLVPLAREYDPQLLFLSAGYDAHSDDPLAQCELESEDFGRMAAAFRALAEELAVPVIVCLEGGYALGALASSVVETIAGLSGDREPPDTGPEAIEPYVARVGRDWPALTR